MKTIALTKGYSCLVDDEDYERLIRHSWTANVHSYAVYAMAKIKQKGVKMHRFIMDFPEGMEVDHINGTNNGMVLDNRRSNLRVATRGLNKRNTFKAPRNSSSGFLGVHAKRNKWIALVYPGRKAKQIGTYASKEAAHTALELWKLQNNYRQNL